MTMPVRDYVYDAVILRAQDGDSVVLDVDLGGNDPQHGHWKCRMEGYDAPGRYTEQGKAATAYLRSLLRAEDGTPRPLVIGTKKDRGDKYGRLLVRVWVKETGVEVGPAMVAAGFGVPWDGTGPHPPQPGGETAVEDRPAG